MSDEVRVVDVNEKFGLLAGYWQPRIVGELNESYVKVAKLKGEFFWHRHENEDELFLVVKGTLKIRLRDGDITIQQGQFAIVPKGVEHLPIAVEEVQVMLLEPKSTVNTGDVRNERTVKPEWI